MATHIILEALGAAQVALVVSALTVIAGMLGWFS